MDPELLALASTAATTVVTLLTTDGWGAAKKALGTLWRRVRPERAERIEAAVSDSREDLLAARERGDDGVEQEIVTQWDSQLRALLAAAPDAADVLRELLERELQPALIAMSGPQTTTSITTTVRADARDHGQSFASGRDMTVHTTQKP
jgi:hypothetical protein